MSIVDAGFLSTKKLVHHIGVPMPFSIYSGVLEDIYLLNNSVMYSSVCTPGVYKILGEYLAHIPSKRVTIIDDIMGYSHFFNWKRPIVNYTRYSEITAQLLAMNRVIRDTNQSSDPIVFTEDTLYWVANPIACEHYNRLNELNTTVIEDMPSCTFVIPVGTHEKAPFMAQFLSSMISRPVFLVVIPAPLIDSCYVIVPALDLKIPVSQRLCIKPLPLGRKQPWSLKYERDITKSLYG